MMVLVSSHEFDSVFKFYHKNGERDRTGDQQWGPPLAELSCCSLHILLCWDPGQAALK